jgi:hypothetical protein
VPVRRRPFWARGHEANASQAAIAASDADAKTLTQKHSITDSINEVTPPTEAQKAEAHHETVATVLQGLEQQLGRLFKIGESQNIYDTIAKAVPADKRSRDPLWRSMSLLRRTVMQRQDSIPSISKEQLLAEMMYTRNLLKADRRVLAKLGVSRPDPTVASLLLSALQRAARQ